MVNVKEEKGLRGRRNMENDGARERSKNNTQLKTYDMMFHSFKYKDFDVVKIEVVRWRKKEKFEWVEEGTKSEMCIVLRVLTDG